MEEYGSDVEEDKVEETGGEEEVDAGIGAGDEFGEEAGGERIEGKESSAVLECVAVLGDVSEVEGVPAFES